MKPQLLELQNKLKLKILIRANSGEIIRNLTKSIIMIFFIVMLFGCKSDIKTIQIYGEIDTLPEMIAKDIEFIRSDSGFVQALLTSPLMYKYSGDKPYIEFPDGFKIQFYDSLFNVKSFITANYGISYERKKRMEAYKNVVIINNEKNEKLNTEHLIWDQNKKKIFSNVAVKITTKDEVIFGDSLESDETFGKYEIRNPSGTINVKDDE